MIKVDNSTNKTFGHSAKKWLLRFIKFNVIGFSVFLISSAIFAISFNTFGAWTWVVANGFGGIMQFTLITYFNRTKIGKIFDSCEARKQEN